MPWLTAYSLPVIVLLVAVIAARWTLASWLILQVTLLLNGVFVFPVTPDQQADVNFWGAQVIGFVMLCLLTWTVLHFRDWQGWLLDAAFVTPLQKTVFRQLFMQPLEDAVFLFTMRQVVVFASWLVVPPAVVVDTSSWAVGAVARHWIDGRLASLVYIVTSLTWYATTINLYQRPMDKVGYAVTTAMLRGLVYFGVALLRIYPYWNGQGMSLLAALARLCCHYPLLALALGAITIEPADWIGRTVRRWRGVDLPALIIINGVNIAAMLWSSAMGRTMAAMILNEEHGGGMVAVAGAVMPHSYPLYAEMSLRAVLLVLCVAALLVYVHALYLMYYSLPFFICEFGAPRIRAINFLSGASIVPKVWDLYTWYTSLAATPVINGGRRSMGSDAPGSSAPLPNDATDTWLAGTQRVLDILSTVMTLGEENTFDVHVAMTIPAHNPSGREMQVQSCAIDVLTGHTRSNPTPTGSSWMDLLLGPSAVSPLVTLFMNHVIVPASAPPLPSGGDGEGSEDGGATYYDVQAEVDFIFRIHIPSAVGLLRATMASVPAALSSQRQLGGSGGTSLGGGLWRHPWGTSTLVATLYVRSPLASTFVFGVPLLTWLNGEWRGMGLLDPVRYVPSITAAARAEEKLHRLAADISRRRTMALQSELETLPPALMPTARKLMALLQRINARGNPAARAAVEVGGGGQEAPAPVVGPDLLPPAPTMAPLLLTRASTGDGHASASAPAPSRWQPAALSGMGGDARPLSALGGLTTAHHVTIHQRKWSFLRDELGDVLRAVYLIVTLLRDAQAIGASRTTLIPLLYEAANALLHLAYDSMWTTMNLQRDPTHILVLATSVAIVQVLLFQRHAQLMLQAPATQGDGPGVGTPTTGIATLAAAAATPLPTAGAAAAGSVAVASTLPSGLVAPQGPPTPPHAATPPVASGSASAWNDATPSCHMGGIIPPSTVGILNPEEAGEDDRVEGGGMCCGGAGVQEATSTINTNTHSNVPPPALPFHPVGGRDAFSAALDLAMAMEEGMEGAIHGPAITTTPAAVPAHHWLAQAVPSWEQPLPSGAGGTGVADEDGMGAAMASVSTQWVEAGHAELGAL